LLRARCAFHGAKTKKPAAWAGFFDLLVGGTRIELVTPAV